MSGWRRSGCCPESAHCPPSLRWRGLLPIPVAPPGRGHRNDVHNWGSWGFIRSDRDGSGTIQMIEDLCQPDWVVQKQPANHCLKPRRPAINRSFSRARATSGTVAAATHEIKFLSSKQFVLLKPGEKSGLGVSSDVSNNSPMQCLCPSGP